VRCTPCTRIILILLQFPRQFFSVPIFDVEISLTSQVLRFSQSYFLEYNPVWSVESQPKFLFATCFMLDSRLAYTSTMEAESTCTSEISVDNQQATWRYIPEEMTLRLSHCSESVYDSSFSSPLSATQVHKALHMCAL
jgi:hypothetical protein